jgi:hypothetical protein
MFGEKLKPTVIPPSFFKRIGQYEIIDKIDGPAPDSITLKEDDGMLVGEAHFPALPDMLLRIGFRPISDSEAVTSGLGTGRGDTLHLITIENEERLGFSGIWMRKKLN